MHANLKVPEIRVTPTDYAAPPTSSPAPLNDERRAAIQAVFSSNAILANRFENAVTNYTINPATGLIVSEGMEYANTDRIRTLIRFADLIRSSVPPVSEGYERLWRGNRPGEIGLNPSFTNSLVGIALPFLRTYGGKLSYVDVPKNELEQYVCREASAFNSEFMLSPQFAARAVAVEGLQYRPSVKAMELYLIYSAQGGTPEVEPAQEWLKSNRPKLYTTEA